MKKIVTKLVGSFTTLALVVSFFNPVVSAPAYAATTWNVGDVFVGVSNGSYNVYDNTGVFKETITSGTGGFTTGCAFNNTLDKLYTTNFSTSRVHVFDDASPHPVTQTINTPADHPGVQANESVVFAANGDFYVGSADGNADLLRYNAAGVFLQAYDLAVEVPGRGSDWIDLAADQKTLFYTSEGRLVKRYDLSTGTQLPDFATLPGPRNPSIAFALRLLPPGDGTGGLLVADNVDIKRLDGAGNVIQTYDIAGEDNWFALNLDPNGTSFWSGNSITGNFYRFNITTGAVEVGPINTGTGANTLFGICVKGELTAAIPEITLGPATATNEVGTIHTVTATLATGGAAVPNEQITFTVVSGPHAGETSGPGECSTDPNCNTDVNGQTSWTYAGTVAGTDTITACFTDDNGDEHCARAQKTWTERVVDQGHMTGGGTIAVGNATLEGKHGFTLSCDATGSNRLQVNWGKGNKFHLETVASAVCVDSTLNEEQPVAGFDTLRGTGTGRLNGVSGATATWVFTDSGEPGVNDTATITITDGVNTYTFTGTLDNGNHQAHAEEV